jgi:hypothetical protein
VWEREMQVRGGTISINAVLEEKATPQNNE